MFYIYILYSHKDRNLYVGQTNDLEKRLQRHEQGQVSATKQRLPITCIYTESFSSRQESMEREKFLKSLWSARFKKKLKADFENKTT